MINLDGLVCDTSSDYNQLFCGVSLNLGLSDS